MGDAPERILHTLKKERGFYEARRSKPKSKDHR